MDARGIGDALLLTEDVRSRLEPLIELVGRSQHTPTLYEVGEHWLATVRERGALPVRNVDSLLPNTVRSYFEQWQRVIDAGALEMPATLDTARWLVDRVPEGSRNAFGTALSAAYHSVGRGREMASGRYWRFKPPVTEVDLGDYVEAARLVAHGLYRALKVDRRAAVGVALAAYINVHTGARPGELVGAKRADLAPGKLRLAAKRRIRWVPLVPRVEQVVLAAAPCWGEYLFPGRTGSAKGHVGITSLGHAMRRWGAPTPYRNRRLFCSFLFDRGASLPVVRALMGHVSAQTTLDHYARATEDRMGEFAGMVADELAAEHLALPGLQISSAANSAHILAEAPFLRVRRLKGKAAIRPSRAAGGRR